MLESQPGDVAEWGGATTELSEGLLQEDPA